MLQLSPEINNSLHKFMQSAKSIVGQSASFNKYDIADALNESWDFYAGGIDANSTPTKVKNILSDLINRFPGFSPVVESDGIKKPEGTALGGGDGPKEELEDQPDMEDFDELNSNETMLTREPVNDHGETPIIPHSEKGMSGKNTNGSGTPGQPALESRQRKGRSLEESLAASFSGRRPSFKQAGSGQAAGRLHPSPTEEEEEGFAEAVAHEPSPVATGPYKGAPPTLGALPAHKGPGKLVKGKARPEPRTRGPLPPPPARQPRPGVAESCDAGAVCDDGVPYPSKAAAKSFKKAKKDGSTSESIMKSNVSKLSGYVKQSLVESAKGLRGGKHAVTFNVAVLEGEFKNRTVTRTQLSEALADAEEILQLHNPNNVALEATFSNAGQVVGHQAIPLFAVAPRPPIMTENKAIFRFRRSAEAFANDLVSEGLICRVNPHHWGSLVEVPMMSEDVSHVFYDLACNYFTESKFDFAKKKKDDDGDDDSGKPWEKGGKDKDKKGGGKPFGGKKAPPFGK